MKTAIYLRVSTTEQALEGYGLDAQRTKCLAMCTVKGWPAPVEYADEGISGTKDESERPGLAALLEAIAARKVDTVIVSSIDRIGRSTALVLKMVERMENGGADLVSCKESLDTTTAAGRFVLRMFASLAELDRDNIVERTTGGRNERGKKDGEKGGRMPLGYVRTAAGIEIDPEAASNVMGIFELRRMGDTLTAIANKLNDGDVPTRHGAKWYASSVREVLLNETDYRGGYRGESKERWPVILED
jgi:site-specific DNA recombinase